MSGSSAAVDHYTRPRQIKVAIMWLNSTHAKIMSSRLYFLILRKVCTSWSMSSNQMTTKS
ncbi:unnamed protein product [Linum tenue]|uniref:Uncharacterized protein n=1 Tax=Linum tenue TaxID=586396 RepID=A0AAV0HV76_9ROSI|nr:unnamed protein product [Linum tenue]